MSEEDYKAIAEIIEEVIGKDTMLCLKLLEGIKFYFENKTEEIKIVKSEELVSFDFSKIARHRIDSQKAMEAYTAKLIKENKKFKQKKRVCTTSS